MTAVLIVFLLIYGIGGLIWVFDNILEYNHGYRDDEKRRAARNLILTPVWIFYGTYLLGYKLKDVWKVSGLADDLKTFQDNSRKEEKVHGKP